MTHMWPLCLWFMFVICGWVGLIGPCWRRSADDTFAVLFRCDLHTSHKEGWQNQPCPPRLFITSDPAALQNYDTSAYKVRPKCPWLCTLRADECYSWINWQTTSSWHQIAVWVSGSAFCVIWVMEVFFRNEKMFSIWWSCASFLVFTRSSSIMTSNCYTWNAFVLRVWRDAWSISSMPAAFHNLCTLDYLLHSHQCQQLERIFSS